MYRRRVLNEVLDASKSLPAPGTEEILRVGGDVLPPKVIQQVQPVYPTNLANVRRDQPFILVELIIDKSGEVRDATVKRGVDDPYTPYVLEAVERWRFAPATRKGEPVSVRFTMSVLVEVR